MMSIVPGSRLALTNPWYWLGVAGWCGLVGLFIYLAVRETDPLKYLALLALGLVAVLVVSSAAAFMRVHLKCDATALVVYPRTDRPYAIERAHIAEVCAVPAGDAWQAALIPWMAPWMRTLSILTLDGDVIDLDEVLGTPRRVDALASSLTAWADAADRTV